MAPPPRRIDQPPVRAFPARLEIEDETERLSRLTPRGEVHVRPDDAKAMRRAAKHAARLFAALEKKEARERKALAKAAAKREAARRTLA